MAAATLALSAALALPAIDRVHALDDRYPAPVVAPAPQKPAVEPRGPRRRTWQPAPATQPAPGPPVVAKPARPPLATTMAPPAANPALAGITLDPAWPKQLFVIGDSVMLGAKPHLEKAFPDWQVTFHGRPALMVQKAIGELPYRVGSVAVIALGYNSLWQKERLNFNIWADRFDKAADEMIAALKARGAKKVVWVLLRELNPDNYPSNGTAVMQSQKYSWYFPYVNERLRIIKQRNPDLALADWVTAARQGGITYDAIHLNPRGAELMVNVVRVAVGLDPLPPKPVGPVVAEPKPAEPEPKPPEPQAATQPGEPLQIVTQPPAPPSPPASEDPPPIRKSLLDPAPEPGSPIEKPTYAFRDCAACPEMVILPAATFTMGSPDSEAERSANEGPQRAVTIARPFAVGKFEVTFAEWEACVAAGGCKGNPEPADEGWGKGRQPVINVSWADAQEYVAWLSQATGKSYRLLTEAEWEYAARGGSIGPYATGDTITPEQANFQTPFKDDGTSREGEYREQTVQVGSFAPNAFGLHDMHGNVSEWVQDNWHEDYADASITTGAVRNGGDASQRTLRGGGWYSHAPDLRSAARRGDQAEHRSGDIGFRVARGL